MHLREQYVKKLQRFAEGDSGVLVYSMDVQVVVSGASACSMDMQVVLTWRKASLNAGVQK